MCGGKDRFRFSNMQGNGSVFCNQCEVKTGDGISSVMKLRGWSFEKAIEECEKQLGIHHTVRMHTKKLKGDFSFFIDRWCKEKKPGTTLQSVMRSGGEVFEVPDQGKGINCIGFPILSETNTRLGDVFYPLDGKPLHTRKGEVIKGPKIRPRSQPGWVGERAVKLLAQENSPVEVVFKCEGITDMLAVDSLLTSEKHVAITNHAGAKSVLPRSRLECLRGKKLVIVADNDEAGQAGAAKWARETLGIPAKTLILVPPAEGQDIRDWLRSIEPERRREQFFAAVKALTPYTAEKAETEAQGKKKEELDDLDPIRMAEQFAEKNQVISWGGNFYHRTTGSVVWQARGANRSTSQFTAILGSFLDAYVDRVYQVRRAMNASVERPKVSMKLIQEVAGQLERRNCTESDFEINCQYQRGPLGLYETDGVRRDWLYVKNGLLMLDRVGEGQCLFQDVDNFFTTYSLEFPYDPDAGPERMPNFLKLLDEQIGRADGIMMLQDYLGYIISHSLELQKFLLLHGESNSGKSSILAVIRALCGRNGFSSLAIDDFGHPFRMAQTLGKACNVADETGEIGRLAEHIIKVFTSGEPMCFESKYANPISVRPTAKLVLATNPEPRFRDRSDGPWRRMCYIRMDNVIPKHLVVRGMTSEQWWMPEMPSILNFAIEGYHRIRKRGFIFEDPESEREKSHWKKFNRPELQFFEEHIAIEEGATLYTKDLIAQYGFWCRCNAHRQGGSNWLFQRLESQFPQLGKRKREPAGQRCYYYEGARLIRPVDPIALSTQGYQRAAGRD